MKNVDAVIIGGGAAGLMCALRAGQRGKSVVLIEHNQDVGSKILISGGGRCNFTNLGITPQNYLSHNPHFCISALKGFTQHQFIDLVEAHKISYHEKTLGQLFCDGSARQIVQMLLDECVRANVEILRACSVQNVTKPTDFIIETTSGNLHCKALVLATGGLSIPKLGASSFAYDIARKFGLSVVAPRPGLVPLTFSGDELELMRPLSGLSLEVRSSINNTRFLESMVFTHRGLSGPAILQISSCWNEGLALRLNLLPNTDDVAGYLVEQKAKRAKSELKTILGEVLPKRLAEALCQSSFSSRAMATYSNKELASIAQHITEWSLQPTGTEGFAKAEVTLGGIDTCELSSKTMEAKKVPGLYVIGEAVDVTGWLGGYNFQWAWSSGWAAGSAI